MTPQISIGFWESFLFSCNYEDNWIQTTSGAVKLCFTSVFVFALCLLGFSGLIVSKETQCKISLCLAQNVLCFVMLSCILVYLIRILTFYSKEKGYMVSSSMKKLRKAFFHHLSLGRLLVEAKWTHSQSQFVSSLSHSCYLIVFSWDFCMCWKWNQ